MFKLLHLWAVCPGFNQLGDFGYFTGSLSVRWHRREEVGVGDKGRGQEEVKWLGMEAGKVTREAVSTKR